MEQSDHGAKPVQDKADEEPQRKHREPVSLCPRTEPAQYRSILLRRYHIDNKDQPNPHIHVIQKPSLHHWRASR